MLATQHARSLTSGLNLCVLCAFVVNSYPLALCPSNQQQIRDVVQRQQADQAPAQVDDRQGRKAARAQSFERLLKPESRGDRRHAGGHRVGYSGVGAFLAQPSNQVVPGENTLGSAEVVEHRKLTLLSAEQQLDGL